MLIFDPKPSCIAWHHLLGTSSQEGVIESNPSNEHKPDLISLPAEQDTIAYVLQNGGAEVTQPVSHLSAKTIQKIERCLDNLPDDNRKTIRLIMSGLNYWPNAHHILLCETAYFHRLPKAVSSYALPFELRAAGIQRYGGDGLCHHWAWRQVRAHLTDTLQRVISVHLDEAPNVAALLDGIAVETSQGFSQIEGIPSMTSCGDLDPTIVLMLRTNGMPLEQIETMLRHQSGFMAMLDHPSNFQTFLADETDQTINARQLLYHKLLEAIGSAIAALGGLDALVFTSSDLVQSQPFINRICSGLDFLHVQFDGNREIKDSGLTRLSSEVSSIQIFGLKYNRWNVLAETVKLFQALDPAF